MGAVRSLRFSSDGRFLAMAEPADFVHVFDVKSGFHRYVLAPFCYTSKKKEKRKKRKRKGKCMPLVAMTGASAPRSSPSPFVTEFT